MCSYNIVNEGMRSRGKWTGCGVGSQIGKRKVGGEVAVLAQNNLRLSPFGVRGNPARGWLDTKPAYSWLQRKAATSDLAAPTFTKKRLLRNSDFLLQVVVRSKQRYNILRFKPHDFEFRNSLKNVKVGQPRKGPKSPALSQRTREGQGTRFCVL